MDTTAKVRLNKERCISGLDGMENLYLPVKEEKNEAETQLLRLNVLVEK